MLLNLTDCIFLLGFSHLKHDLSLYAKELNYNGILPSVTYTTLASPSPVSTVNVICSPSTLFFISLAKSLPFATSLPPTLMIRSPILMPPPLTKEAALIAPVTTAPSRLCNNGELAATAVMNAPSPVPSSAFDGFFPARR